MGAAAKRNMGGGVVRSEESLDKIDWASFSVSYGTGEDIPRLLRALTDPAESAAALSQLMNAVNHQGWVSPAGIACVPWLVSVLDHPAVPLATMVRLLADLTLGGNHESWLGDALHVGRHEDIYPFVNEARSTFVALLSHEDAKVRAAAALALAAISVDTSSVAELNAAYAKERTADVKASLLLAIATQGQGKELADDAVEEASLALARSGGALRAGMAHEEGSGRRRSTRLVRGQA